jgi:hypothetical protein
MTSKVRRSPRTDLKSTVSRDRIHKKQHTQAKNAGHNPIMRPFVSEFGKSLPAEIKEAASVLYDGLDGTQAEDEPCARYFDVGFVFEGHCGIFDECGGKS